MKKHLNTLYVTTQGAYLAKEGETVAVKVDGKVCLKVPIHTIGGIVCFGQVSCSPFLMHFCAEQNVGVSFLTENGRFLAKVEGSISGSVLLRRHHYRKADDPDFSSQMAKLFVIGKIVNSRSVLQRSLRDHAEKDGSEQIRKASDHLKAKLNEMHSNLPLESVRGTEGDAARTYFSVFDHLITSQKDSFAFKARSRRPPLDKINCLLSFLYTLLVHDIRSALEAAGLDPQVGFLHKDRPGRPGLALDIMEEFRPFIADRLALTLVNLNQVRQAGFQKTASNAVLMDDETRKAVLVAYQKRKQDQIVHPFLEEKVSIGLLFHIQAMLLARCLRGDIDAYPPFIWK
ncbi:MAG: type I-C CRISPR-associated endonuclease Cas1c [Desulfobacteraceae bacterium]|nr:type I-C CRISPR-associated endonuclease Cas1c [Desulfobacteraceae bacterium]